MGIWRYGRATAARLARNATWRASGGSTWGSCAARTCRCCSSGCLELLAPALDRPAGRACTSTSRSASAGTPRRCCEAHPGRGPDRTRPGHRGARARPASGWPPFADAYAPRARGLRRAAGGARPSSASRRSTGCCSTSASPRCSSTSRTGASPTPGTRRWTCGWTRRAGSRPRRSSTATPQGSWSGSCGCTARRSSPRGSCRRSCGSGPRRRITSVGAARRAGPGRDPGGRRGEPVDNPAKRTFQALRIEVNGELVGAGGGAAGGAGRARPGRADRGAVATTRWRTGSSSGPSPRGPAATGPIDLPVELPGTGPTLRLLTRGSRLPSDGGGGGEPAGGVGEAAGGGTDRARQRSPANSGAAGSRHCTSPPRERGTRAVALRADTRRRGRGHERAQARTAVGGPDRGAARSASDPRDRTDPRPRGSSRRRALPP